MIISIIESTRTKWFKKYFFHMIDMCLWNVYCLCKLKTGAISMAQFHLKLIHQILTKYHKTRTRHSTNCGNNNELRLIYLQEKVNYEDALFAAKIIKDVNHVISAMNVMDCVFISALKFIIRKNITKLYLSLLHNFQ